MKYRKKPIVIEAIQWTGDNLFECLNFIDYTQSEIYNIFHNCNNEIGIQTLEGTMLASVGDYIIRGVAGEFYPCKPDIFEKTYEKVEELEDEKTN